MFKLGTFPTRNRVQRSWNHIAALILLREGRPKNFQTIDNLRIQKLGFRSEVRGQQEGQLPAYFKFFRYDLGPYSKELANEIAALETRDFVNPATRGLTWRGEYLLEYIQPEIKRFEVAQKAVETIQMVCEEDRSIKLSSELVDETYRMQVPVAQFGDRIMLVKDIPMNTDIITPDPSYAPAILSNEMVDNLEEEWKIDPAALDESSEAFNEAVDSAFLRAMAV
jgi:uncharacterized protein YwgA